MSLINNALKKAQRQRAAEAEAVSGGSIAPIRRGKSGLPAQTLVLIVAGAAVIVVLSVVATVYLLKPAPVPSPAAPATPVVTAAAPTPEVTMPAVKLPEPEPAHSAPTASNPEPITSTATVTTAEPAAAEPVSAPPAATLEPARADERVYTFIDNLQVMGVRSSGTDSKVLMNDRVYRVNDIVDRTLALRLIQVAPDRLVFEDANGITYTKTF